MQEDVRWLRDNFLMKACLCKIVTCLEITKRYCALTLCMHRIFFLYHVHGEGLLLIPYSRPRSSPYSMSIAKDFYFNFNGQLGPLHDQGLLIPCLWWDSCSYSLYMAKVFLFHAHGQDGIIIPCSWQMSSSYSMSTAKVFLFHFSEQVFCLFLVQCPFFLPTLNFNCTVEIQWVVS